MPDSEIEDLLKKATGLKVTSLGKGTLFRSVQKRMQVLSIKDLKTYAEKLKSSEFELKELIEEVVIPETWFFRDHEPFKAMIQYLEKQWAPNNKNLRFKVLSLPCSTGEEPYSLVMSLLNSGFPAEKFIVHACDISNRSIAKGKEGVYSENSFRGSDLGYRSRYFTKSSKVYILNKNVRDKVRFHTGNILNKRFTERLGVFDVIFFRNVLIYFDALSRQQAISNLYDILADDGILFVGHSEGYLLKDFSFTPAPYPQAFAFHKNDMHSVPFTKAPKALMARSKRRHPSVVKRLVPSRETDLTLANELADKGDLKKAAEICEEYLNRFGPSVQAFFLLGIIGQAANDTEQAEKCFRKVLYLEPDNKDALNFLAILVEKKGNFQGAKALKQRLDRLQIKNTY